LVKVLRTEVLRHEADAVTFTAAPQVGALAGCLTEHRL
jgi:hypothetical protein